MRGTEFAGVFHHVSRHLSDQSKHFSVDWNLVGARVRRRVAAGPWIVDAQAGVGAAVNHHHVDYRWIGGFERRVDADPLDWAPRRWALAGFRLVSP